MDLADFRSFISDSGVDVWTWIDLAISVASVDHGYELRNRRDGIVQKLYAPPPIPNCRSCGETALISENYRRFDCDSEGMRLGEGEGEVEVVKKEVVENDEDEEQRKVLEIKALLDDQNQSERCLIELLQRLVDMDTTFKALKETDIGRHVTKLRKHSSNEVRRLVKVLVRKWKDTVDEWVILNTPAEEEEGDKNSPYHEITHSCVNTDISTPPKRKMNHSHKESDHNQILHAKKQRTTQVMDFHDMPKLKNSNVPNKGGSVPIKYC